MRIMLKSAYCSVVLFSTCAMWAANQPTPPGFGATHFIVGMSAPAQRAVVDHNPSADERIAHILFSPDDNVSARLIELINQETRSIKVAIFLFTHEQITQALLNAHQRGVMIEIIVDPKHMYDKFSRIEQLCKGGVCVFVFNPKYADSAGVGLMHNKFAVFGHQGMVWTGSFNFTGAACKHNQEHVVVLQGATVMQRFADQFECLKGRSTRYAMNTAKPVKNTIQRGNALRAES